MRLEEIAKKHGTLKVQHGFMPIYERFFEPLREKIINLLEIGVHEGASLRTWEEYFKYGFVVGIDKILIYEPHKRKHIKVFECDPSESLNDGVIHYGKYDIIIDDASHIGTEQLATFNNLWNLLIPGGYYVVEDLFAAYDKTWNPDGHPFIDHIQSRLKNILIGGDSIQEVHWFGRNDINGILFLRKRHEEFRIQPLSEFA